MAWRCPGCSAKQRDQFLWCTSCDHAKRRCDDCNTPMRWREREVDDASVIGCPRCGREVGP